MTTRGEKCHTRPVKIWKLAGIVTLSVSLLAVHAYAANSGEEISHIHVVTPEWPRQTQADGTGLFFEILRNVYEPVGITLTYEFVPWKRAERMIQKKQADVRVAVVRSRPDQLMPIYPLYVDYTVAVFKKTAVQRWKGMETLDGQRAVSMRGYNFHKFPEFEGIHIDWAEVNTHKQAWKMLHYDRVDFYIDALIDVGHYIRTHHIDMTPYQMEILYSKNAYLEFAHTPRSETLLHIYERRIVELLRSGDLERIFAKWNVKFDPFEIAREHQ